MTRREGGRFFLRDLVGLPFGDEFSGPEDDVGAGVDDLDLDRTRERSIHWFSGGNCGVVYCERAFKLRSHFFGAHTPMRARHAATNRFAL